MSYLKPLVKYGLECAGICTEVLPVLPYSLPGFPMFTAAQQREGTDGVSLPSDVTNR